VVQASERRVNHGGNLVLKLEGLPFLLRTTLLSGIRLRLMVC
jgi:hypothetical protein